MTSVWNARSVSTLCLLSVLFESASQQFSRTVDCRDDSAFNFTCGKCVRLKTEWDGMNVKTASMGCADCSPGTPKPMMDYQKFQETIRDCSVLCDEDTKLSVWVIIGPVIGFVLLVGIGIFVYVRCKKKQQPPAEIGPPQAKPPPVASSIIEGTAKTDLKTPEASSLFIPRKEDLKMRSLELGEK